MLSLAQAKSFDPAWIRGLTSSKATWVAQALAGLTDQAPAAAAGYVNAE